MVLKSAFSILLFLPLLALGEGSKGRFVDVIDHGIVEKNKEIGISGEIVNKKSRDFSQASIVVNWLSNGDVISSEKFTISERLGGLEKQDFYIQIHPDKSDSNYQLIGKVKLTLDQKETPEEKARREQRLAEKIEREAAEKAKREEGKRKAYENYRKYQNKLKTQKSYSVKVESWKWYQDGNWAKVVGEVQNKTDGVIESLKIIATFYDKKGDVLATGFTYARPSTVAPGRTVPFELNEEWISGMEKVKISLDWR